MPVDLDGRESHELPRTVALWDAINDVVAASGGSTTNVSVARQKAVVRVHDALRPLAEELRTLRARVAEMERDARLGAVVRAEVTRDNTYGPNPALDLEVRAIGAREAGNYAIGYLLRAIADALRAEEGGSDA